MSTYAKHKDYDKAIEYYHLLSNKLSAPVLSDGWNNGVNRICYVAPSTFTLNDSINYLLDNYVDSNGFPAILRYNRFMDGFQLFSYYDIFSGYDWQLKEVFTFPDSTNLVAPIGPARAKRQNVFNFGSFSVMNGYKHTKMAGMDSMKAINSKSVNWYNPVSKTFHTEMTKNSASVAKSQFSKLVSGLNSSRSTPMFTLNKTKTTNKAIDTRYISGTYQSNGGEVAGVCNTLKGALFLNDCISFTALGLPIRTAGTFIEVSSNKDLQGIWEDRFLGAWFVTDVEHDIGVSTYVNNITAIKPNATENFDVPEDV
jgi:hypothetical protein